MRIEWPRFSRARPEGLSFTPVCVKDRGVSVYMAGTPSSVSRLRHRVQLTTDGLRHYLLVVPNAFRNEIDYALLRRTHTTPIIALRSHMWHNRRNGQKAVWSETKQPASSPATTQTPAADPKASLELSATSHPPTNSPASTSPSSSPAQTKNSSPTNYAPSSAPAKSPYATGSRQANG